MFSITGSHVKYIEMTGRPKEFSKSVDGVFHTVYPYRVV